MRESSSAICSERTADFRTAARHRFEQHGRRSACAYHLVKQLCGQRNAFFNSLADVAAGMEIVYLIWKIFHTYKILAQAAVGEIPNLFV
jgi:hypothetical protein